MVCNLGNEGEKLHFIRDYISLYKLIKASEYASEENSIRYFENNLNASLFNISIFYLNNVRC